MSTPNCSRRWLYATLLVSIAAFALASCGAGTGRLEAGSQYVESAGESLTLLPATLAEGVDGLRAEYTEKGTAAVVELHADGVSDLKAFYARLRIDAGRYELAGFTPGDCWGDTEQLLSLAVEGEPGVVDIGVALAHYEKRDGISGDCVLGKVELAPRDSLHPDGAAADQGEQAGSREASSYEKESSAVYISYHGAFLRWWQNLPGDYNQNGEVEIGDLTPLALHLGEQVESLGNSFNDHPLQYILDGDNNNEINLADLTVIGLYYGARIDGWEAYYQEDAQAPADQGQCLFAIDYARGVGDPAADRLCFEHGIELAEMGAYYYVYPVIDGVRGEQQGPPQGLHYPYEIGSHPTRVYYDEYSLSWDSDNGELIWYYSLYGDADYNGAVKISDLSEIGIHFNEDTRDVERSDLLWLTDTNRDGEINLSDLTPIGVNFESELDGVFVYTTLNPDDLADAELLLPELEPIAQVVMDRTGEYENSLGPYRLPLEAVSGQYFWLRPYIDDASHPYNTGVASNVIQVP